MENHYRRRIISLVTVVIAVITVIVINYGNPFQSLTNPAGSSSVTSSPAIAALSSLSIKGRAPKTDYSRAQFGNGWKVINGCDTREIILNRDLTNVVLDQSCNVVSGILNDPYTGKTIQFSRGASSSSAVQIDHVVALSDAWQKGAQNITATKREELANDPLELLAVDGPTNLNKLDGDAATWLPPNKNFRCQYVARQIAVKQKYQLWVTQAEHDAIQSVLASCPNQPVPNLSFNANNSL